MSGVLPAAIGVILNVLGSGSDCTERRQVGIVQDITKSRHQNLVPRLTLADLDSWLESLNTCGDYEVGLTLISDSSNSDLLRIRVPARPTPPSPPARSGNLFEDSRRRRSFERLREKFLLDEGAWQRETDGRIGDFRLKAQHLLNADDAPATNANRALQRMKIFFGEAALTPHQPTRQVLIAISDLDNNVRDYFDGLPSDVEVYVVNGLGKTGVLTGTRLMIVGSLSKMSAVLSGGKGGR